ncbi:MAG: 50S ribosomal protein L23 [Candidatus Wildermuthbacteria bacterium]|nr:50S ribosomal protein L23 [Candidatus Wildermuthbacteria bacterium]
MATIRKIFKKKPAEPKKKTAAKKEASEKNSISFSVLSRPHITEKAVALSHSNQYVFEVADNATKGSVCQAVESLYSVNVLGVRIINVHPRKARLGRILGMKKGYKKAIVTLKQGQKLELLPT